MKSVAIILVILLGVGGSAFPNRAFAQNAVGGPVKPKAVGGPVKQSSPVVPTPKRVSTTVSPTVQAKCVGACAAAKANR
jgi:hypothetical protein